MLPLYSQMLNVDLFSYYPNLNANFCIIKIDIVL
jgi:hypothetical protein